MFSDYLLRMIAWRIYLVELTFCSPVHWDWSTGLMRRKKSYPFWNWIFVNTYLFVYGLLVFIRLYWKLTSGKGNDIPDDAEEVENAAFEALLNAIDFIYVSVCALVFGLAMNMIRSEGDLFRMWNRIIEIDKTLSEQYKQQLRSTQRAKGYSRRADVTLTFASVITFLIPFAFPLLLLLKIEPLNRFFQEVLEIEIKPEVKFIPLFACLLYFITAFNNTVLIYAINTNLHIHTCCYWLENASPHGQFDTKRLTEDNPHFTTDLGLISGESIMNIYRQTHYLARLAYNSTAHVLLSFHHFGELIIFVSTLYMSIRFFEDALTQPGLQLSFAVPVLVIVVESLEAFEISRVHDKSKLFIEKIKFIFSLSYAKRRSLKAKEYYRIMKSANVLWFETAYPFYRYSKGTLMEFVHGGLDLLVSFLVG